MKKPRKHGKYPHHIQGTAIDQKYATAQRILTNKSIQIFQRPSSAKNHKHGRPTFEIQKPTGT